MTDERVVLAPSTIIDEAFGVVPEGFSLRVLDEGVAPGTDELAAEVLVLGAELRHLMPRLAEFERLELVQTLNAGIEMMLPHIPPGVTLCNASGVHDIPVAEWVVGVLVALRRGFLQFAAAQRDGRWDTAGNALTTPPDQIPFVDLDGADVLIIGHGSIGRRIERLLDPFGATVTGVAFHPRPGVHGPDDIDDLLPRCDAVVLMTPLTDETRGLLGADRLSLLRDGAVVINAARGAVLDQEALEAELRSGRLAAALDVTDPEPLPAGHSLWSAPNVIITPHTAGSSRSWMYRAHAFAGEQLRRYAAGDPLDNVRADY
ncbi:MAG: NAD(P)-dependent oxidoreductase [Ilumatobacter sp.]|uniref:NAD(P)-dependent oxidoreductase n=1 Tax=Ilumatobacter sp. TaxID=1967498 RepID=UPI00391AD9BD